MPDLPEPVRGKRTTDIELPNERGRSDIERDTTGRAYRSEDWANAADRQMGAQSRDYPSRKPGESDESLRYRRKEALGQYIRDQRAIGDDPIAKPKRKNGRKRSRGKRR